MGIDVGELSHKINGFLHTVLGCRTKDRVDAQLEVTIIILQLAQLNGGTQTGGVTASHPSQAVVSCRRSVQGKFHHHGAARTTTHNLGHGSDNPLGTQAIGGKKDDGRPGSTIKSYGNINQIGS